MSQLPIRKTGTGDQVDTRPMYIEEWLDTLPYIDFNKTAALIEQALAATNKQEIKPSVRLDLMTLYHGPYEYYLESQIKAGAQHTLQTIEAMQSQLGVMKQIAVHLSYGCKMAFDQSQTQKSFWKPGKPPYEAVLMSMNYLSQALIFSYLEYSPVPKNVWKQLNFIYDIAASSQCEKRLFTIPGDEISNKGISFEHNVVSELPTIVRGDETRLRQLLLNLLSNAVKFTSQGKVIFNVGLVKDFVDDSKSVDGHKIRFQILDTGIGIAEDQLEEIFLPFHQLTYNFPSQEGTGLGLSISQNIAKQMGSDIKVKSKLGQGSAFWFDLDFPHVETSVEINQAHDLVLDITGYVGDRKTILVVDDLDNNREVLVKFLQPLGFEVIAVNCGKEAIAQTKKQNPDLIILDLVMPEIDGLGVTRTLRDTEGYEDLPIVIVSASSLPADESQCYQAGANAFLAKPLKFDRVLRLLQQYLQLEWLAEDGSTRSLLQFNNGDMTPDNEISNLVMPTEEEINLLLNLVNGGDIRELLLQLDRLQEDQFELIPFIQQIRDLAQSCQLKKLKDLLSQDDRG